MSKKREESLLLQHMSSSSSYDRHQLATNSNMAVVEAAGNFASNSDVSSLFANMMLTPSASHGWSSSASSSPYSSNSYLAPFSAVNAPQSQSQQQMYRSSSQTFTAAMFAQTKFGSTKLKTQQVKRPSRLSPTELMASGSHQRQQRQSLAMQNGGYQYPWATGASSTSPVLSARSSPCSLQTSPRDFYPSADMFVEQQQRNGRNSQLMSQSQGQYVQTMKQQQQQPTFHIDASNCFSLSTDRSMRDLNHHQITTSNSWSEMSNWSNISNEFPSPVDSNSSPLMEEPSNSNFHLNKSLQDPINHNFGLMMAS